MDERTPTLREFAPRFVDGYAKANRLEPIGIAAKKTVLKVHPILRLGDKALDQIDGAVQRLKSALERRAAKSDVDLAKRQLRSERSDWKGHVTATKGGESATCR